MFRSLTCISVSFQLRTPMPKDGLLDRNLYHCGISINCCLWRYNVYWYSYIKTQQDEYHKKERGDCPFLVGWKGVALQASTLRPILWRHLSAVGRRRSVRRVLKCVGSLLNVGNRKCSSEYSPISELLNCHFTAAWTASFLHFTVHKMILAQFNDALQGMRKYLQ
jgi:hypothetical protein